MTDWRTDASCRGEDPELFFPLTPAAEEAALKICRDCPVRVPCGQFAYENGEEFGIFGGLTERERRKMRSNIATPPPTKPLKRCKGCRTIFSPADPSTLYCSVSCRPSSGQAWTADEVATLAEMATAGLSDAAIARVIGRTPKAVAGRRNADGIPVGRNRLERSRT